MNFSFYLVWYSYVKIDFGVQKSDQFIINDMAVQSEIRDMYRATKWCFTNKFREEHARIINTANSSSVITSLTQ